VTDSVEVPLDALQRTWNLKVAARIWTVVATSFGTEHCAPLAIGPCACARRHIRAARGSERSDLGFGGSHVRSFLSDSTQKGSSARPRCRPARIVRIAVTLAPRRGRIGRQWRTTDRKSDTTKP
jgi:hypothetical protein